VKGKEGGDGNGATEEHEHGRPRKINEGRKLMVSEMDDNVGVGRKKNGASEMDKKIGLNVTYL
ncbi:hypothetical protein A2U01_0064575, partial [Trifolium medium]|nr:hypothetical protein [Trifolium medium]